MKKPSTSTLIPFLAVIVVAVLLLAPSLFQSRIPAQTDWLYMYGPWYGLEPPQIHNPNGGDSFFVYLPDRLYALGEWRAGRLPLWNPYPSGGTPIMGAQTAQPLDPLILLQFLFHPGRALGITYALLLSLAGWGMVLFLRARGVKSPAALAVGGVVFAANPYFIYWLELRVFLAGLAALPLALWALERALRSPGSRRGIAGLGLAVGFAALAGTLQTLVLFLGILGLRWIALVLETRSAPDAALVSGRRLGLPGLGILAGLAVGAIPLAASTELLRESTRMGESSIYYAGANFLHWRALALWFNPEVFGGVTDKVFTARELFGRTMASGSGWGAMGMVPLGLAVFALVRPEVPRREKLFWGGLAGGVLLLLLATRGPLYGILAGLWPGLHNVDLLRGLFVVNLGGAVLAAWGGQALVTAWRTGSRVWILCWTALILFGLGAVLLGRHGLQPPHGTLRDLAPVLIIGAAVAAVSLLGGKLGIHPSWRLGILLVITLFELGRAHYRFNTFASADTLYFGGSPMDRMRAVIGPPHYYRFMTVGGAKAYPPNTGALFGLSDMRSYTNLPIARFRLLLECAEGRRDLGNQPQVNNVTSPVYRLLGGKTTITVSRIEPQLFLHEIMPGVHARDDCLPRAFLTHRAELVADEESMRAALSRPDFDPAATVYLEEARGPLPPLAPARGEETVRIRRLAPQWVQIDVNATAPGILVMTDAYYPGWRAWVDGRREPILPVDWGLRGVAVSAGAHEVEFRYEPAWLWPAGIVSGAGLGFLVTMFAWSWFFERPRRAGPRSGSRVSARSPRSGGSRSRVGGR